MQSKLDKMDGRNIGKVVRELIAANLGIPSQDVKSSDRIISDCEMNEIDLLQLEYEISQTFGIPEGDFMKRRDVYIESLDKTGGCPRDRYGRADLTIKEITLLLEDYLGIFHAYNDVKKNSRNRI